MIADVILHNAKNPEKTSPGPAGYSNGEAWEYTQPNTCPNFKQKEDRVTFMQTQTWYAN